MSLISKHDKMVRIQTFISLVLICLLFTQCDDDVTVCDFDGKGEIINNSNGILFLTDSLNGIKLDQKYYFIFNNQSLPLEICNVPKEGFNFYLNQDSVKVIFSGTKEVLPETVDAVSERIEINDIDKK